jgi:hypothetical protein
MSSVFPSALAAQDLAAELAGCAARTDDASRLACFDQLAGRVAAAPAPVAPSPVAVEQPKQARVGEDAFGLMEAVAAREPDRIESRIVGQFNGWYAGMRFRLENSQVWEQLDKITAKYRVENPDVTIRKTPLGSYRAKIDGYNRRVRVRRVDTD